MQAIGGAAGAIERPHVSHVVGSRYNVYLRPPDGQVRGRYESRYTLVAYTYYADELPKISI